jgi:UDP-N-acetylglucosamine 2-epimerase
MGKVKVLTVFGTRPEAIKLAPVVQTLSADPNIVQITCVTGQHRQMLDQVLSVFDIKPEHDLNIMKIGQDLNYVTSAVLQGVTTVLRQERPDWIVVQGDTTTAFAAALAGFYERVPVAHVEAGLRTHNRNSPWPEEINRRLVAPLSDLHFAPTQCAADNLLRENISSDDVIVTGNTVIDALRWTAARPEGDIELQAVLSRYAPALLDSKRPIILVTLHRRENLGEKLHSICQGLRKISQRGDVDIAFPVHLNPVVQSTVQDVLGECAHVHRLPPLDYLPFVALLRRSRLVITDSGGIQEEAPGLGKPVLVARDTTERPEAIEAGTAELVGTDGENIATRCFALIDDSEQYLRMAHAVNPFGDGYASSRIVKMLKQRFNRSQGFA